MFLNILHRPARGVWGVFRMQQDWVHKLGLAATVVATYPSMLRPGQVEQMRRDRDEFGDEIALALGDLDCPEFRERFHCPMNSIWLYSDEDKRAILEVLVQQYRRCFGGHPTAVASYFLDASTMDILADVLPGLQIAVAACFEEGVKVFHGCNNSWYLFNEGGPWSAWYPARGNTLRPAANADDARGPVAVCHLSRDPALSYESRNDFWASHPANVQRGLGNRGTAHPYDFNLVDMYRAQEPLNDGFSYFNIFVGPYWLTDNQNIEDPVEVGRQMYREQIEYLADLREAGQVADMTMTLFGRWYRDHRSCAESQVFLAKEMLYGSGKHYVWYLDPDMRVLIDTAQGGSIGDLRP